MKRRGILVALGAAFMASSFVSPALRAQNVSGRGGFTFSTTPIQTDPNSNVAIRVATPLFMPPQYGYLPVQVTVENNSDREGSWHFGFLSGAAAEFPGELDSGFDLTVGAGQNKDKWYMIPLPWAGVSTSGQPIGGISGSINLPAAPPTIAGVYPAPKGVASSWRMKSEMIPANPSAGQMMAVVRRTFSITQTGPAASLPAIDNPQLPADTNLVVEFEPAAEGKVKRTATVTIEAPYGGSVGGVTRVQSPMSILTTTTRTQLERAGLIVAGYSVSSSTSAASAIVTATSLQLPVDRYGRAPGMTTITFRFQQTGPAEKMAIPAGTTLPAGTEAEVLPGSSPGESVRTIVVRQTVPTSSLQTTTAIAAARGGAATNPPAAEAVARAIIAPTHLLDQRSGIAETRDIMPFAASGSGTAFIAVFVQTGPAVVLPRPAPVTLPPGVIVNVHPGTSPSQAVRTISYVDPVSLGILATMPAQTSTRYELVRRGFLRSQPGISISNRASSLGGSSISSPFGPAISAILPFGTTIWTETGPEAQLPKVGPEALPPNTTVTITPGVLPGEVSRNFITSGSPSVGYGGISGAGSSSAVSVAAASRALYQVEVSGLGIPSSVRMPIAINSSAGSGSTPPFAVSPAIETDLRAKLNNLGLRSGANISVVDMENIPADWRVWASFHGVVLRAQDYDNLTAPRRIALMGWVAMGGQLFLEPPAEEDGAEISFGAGRIFRMPEPIRDADAGQLALDLHLGTLAVSLPQVEQLKFPGRSSVGSVITDGGFNANSLAIYLGLFAVVIGPLNLFLFAPPAKRHRLFFTTPLIAFLGAVILAGSIVFADGLGGEGRRATLVVLVSGENEAAVFQEQAAQTGVLTKDEFKLDDQTLLTTLPIEGFAIQGRSSNLGRFDDVVSGTWFRSRWQQIHFLRRVAPTRGRVEIVGTGVGGAPIVESTIGTDLKKFSLVDANDEIWVADDLPTGRRTTLSPSPNDQWPRLRTDGSYHMDAVFQSAAHRDPGRWAALGGSTEIAPVATLASIRWTDSPVVYTGMAASTLSVAAR